MALKILIRLWRYWTMALWRVVPKASQGDLANAFLGYGLALLPAVPAGYFGFGVAELTEWQRVGLGLAVWFVFVLFIVTPAQVWGESQDRLEELEHQLAPRITIDYEPNPPFVHRLLGNTDVPGSGKQEWLTDVDMIFFRLRVRALNPLGVRDVSVKLTSIDFDDGNGFQPIQYGGDTLRLRWSAIEEEKLFAQLYTCQSRLAVG